MLENAEQQKDLLAKDKQELILGRLRVVCILVVCN